MNLRAKITISLAAFVFTAVLAAGLYANQLQWRTLESVYADRLARITEEAVQSIEPASFENLIATKDGNSAEYQTIVGVLQPLMKQYGLRGLYTAAMDKNEKPHFIVDANTGPNGNRIWQPYAESMSNIKFGISGALKGKFTTELLTAANKGVRIKRGYAPISNGGQVIGFVVAELPLTNGDKIIGSGWNGIVLGGLFLLLIGLVGAFMIAFSLTNPFYNLVEQAKRISTGDFTGSYDTDRPDEVGVIYRVFANVRFELRQLNAKILDITEETAQNTQNVREFAMQLQEMTLQSAATIKELDKTLNDTRDSAFDPRLIQSFGLVLQELQKQLASLNSLANNALDRARESIVALETLASQTVLIDSDAAMDMQKSSVDAQWVTAINDMVASIEDFAKQTKTLALNATIEAARAGEYGRGFAVVARRIQRLAVSVGNSVENIKPVLAEMAAALAREFEQTGGHQQAVAAMGVTVGAAGEAFASSWQGLDRMLTGLDETAAISAELSRQISVVDARILEITGTAEQTKHGMMDLNAVSGEVSAASTQIVVLANSLQYNLEALRTELAKFKV